jgi:hypothetical protein
MIQTGGTWDPTERFIHFLVCEHNGGQQAESVKQYPSLLVPMDRLDGGPDAALEEMLDSGQKIMLDSGVYALASDHARRHGIGVNDALALPPEQIEGFEENYRRYVSVVNRYGSRLWGYVEIDQGPTEQKRRTRARLHAEGLAPIPVYHPLSDGFEYFDELASGHDRVCWSNLARSGDDMRWRIAAMAFERARLIYPDVWIHYLGLGLTPIFNAYSPDSADSSTWQNVLRWSGYREQSMLALFSYMPTNWKYLLGDNKDESPTSDRQALRMAVNGQLVRDGAWRHWQLRLEEEGLSDLSHLQAV